MAVLRSTNLGEVLTGTATSDVISGGYGSDTISAGDGNDEIVDLGGYANSIDAGAGDDRILFSNGTFTQNYPAISSFTQILAGAGNDFVQITSTSERASSLVINLGSDNDTLLFGNLDSGGGNAGRMTITTGSGIDRIILTSLLDRFAGSYVITDFTAGAGGDILELGSLVAHAFAYPGLVPFDLGTNPFTSGKLFLVQDGADTVVMLDYNGSPHPGDNYETVVVRLNGVSSASLTAYNFSGYDPAGGVMVPVTVAGSAGSDAFVASSAATTYAGLGGSDSITGNVGSDTLDGDAGSDTIRGGLGNDTIRGGADADSLDGGSGDDLVEGGDGDDTITDVAGNDVLRGGLGNDRIILHRPADSAIDTPLLETIVVDAGDGNDFVHYVEMRASSVDYANSRYGYAPGLLLSGFPNASTLAADLGAGNDVFIIEAPRADITVTTGSGSDAIYVDSTMLSVPVSYRGLVTVTDFTAGAGGDVLFISKMSLWFEDSSPFASGDLRVVQSGTSVLVLEDYDGLDGGDVTFLLAVLENVDVNDLTAFNLGGWDPQLSPPQSNTIDGTSGSDAIYGTAGANTINGQGGNDTLTGLHGADILNGGAGDDTLRGGYGNDRLDGGADNDILQDFGNGSDTLIGGTGNDIISVLHISPTTDVPDETITISAGDGDDEVDVGIGRGTITADLGAGNDRYFIHSIPSVSLTLTLGSGQDVVSVSQQLQSGGSVPIVFTDFATGAAGDVFDIGQFLKSSTFSRPYGPYYQHDGSEFYNPFHLGLASLVQVGNDVHLYDQYISQQRPIAVFQNTLVANFTTHNLGIEIVVPTYPGSTGADVFGGTAGDDYALGGNGIDQLTGLGGDDVLNGGAGNDTLNGGAGFNVLIGGDGDNSITGGDDGNFVSSGIGASNIVTGAGADVVISNGGRDTINTGGGNDRIAASGPLVAAMSITSEAGNDEVWLSDGKYSADLGTGNDELHIGGSATVTATLGSGIDHVFLDGRFATVTLNDFVAGNGGDVFHFGDLFFSDPHPLESGLIYVQQVGADTHLYYPTYRLTDPLVIFKNVQASSLTPYNFVDTNNPDGLSPVRPAVTATTEIHTSYTVAQGTVQTSINPSSTQYLGHFVLLPSGPGVQLVNNGTVNTSNTVPGPIGRLYGIFSQGADGAALIENGITGRIVLTAIGIEATGIYSYSSSNSGPRVVNNGVIEVNLTNPNDDGLARGVLYEGPSVDLYAPPPANPVRFTNNGDILVHSEGDAEGVFLETSGALLNTGLISVDADQLAIGVNAEFEKAYTPIDNRGEIIVTNAAASPYVSVGIAIEALGGIYPPVTQTIVNSGLIQAEYAIYVYFESQQLGIAQTLVNSGTINGLVFLNRGDDIVTNTGTMNGALLLGDGNDSYDGRGGFQLGTVEGGLGNDVFLGGSGAEFMYGDQGNDTISAGAGADFVEGGPGSDLLDGGAGIDMLSYLEASAGIHVDLQTGVATSDLEIDYVRGFEDVVGTALDDTILGAGFGEFLFGNRGNDVIDGRAGDDLLIGGKGNDQLTGGQGSDVFLFEAGDGADTITDFAAGDTLRIFGYSTYQSMQQVGSDVRMVLSAGDVVLVSNTLVASLTASNLVFNVGPTGISIPQVRPQAVVVVGDSVIESGAVVTAVDPVAYFEPFARVEVSAAVRSLDSALVSQLQTNEIWNAGTISVTTHTATEWTVGSFDGGAFYNLATGVIAVHADAADRAFGIHYAGTVNNLGSITVTNQGGNAAGVAGLNSGSGTDYFANQGTIQVTASGSAAGLGEANSTAGVDRIFNAGTIEVHGDEASFGIMNAAYSFAPGILVNSGDIVVTDRTSVPDSAGISLVFSGQYSVWNSGLIQGDYAVHVQPTSPASGTQFRLYNTGTLDGDVLASFADDTVVNQGEIRGAVNLGSGNDLYDGRAGQLIGSLDGYDGNDLLLAGSGTQSIRGGFGNDTLSGGAGADELFGGAGTDSFRFGTGFGADVIGDFGLLGTADFIDVEGYTAYQSIVQQGADVLITFSAGDTLLVRSTQLATLTGGAIRFGAPAIAANSIPQAPVAPLPPELVPGSDLEPAGTFPAVIGGEGSDFLFGGLGPDTLIGLAANDTLDGLGGDDLLYGGAGDDTYYVRSSNDLVFEAPGGGNDTVRSDVSFYLYANVENLILTTGAGNLFGVGNGLANRVTGNGDSNLLLGGGGDDFIEGDGGVDSLFGEDGADRLFGGSGVDYLVGGIGNDELDGGAEADALYGQDGDDMLVGGGGFVTDILVGGDGNDTLNGAGGANDYDLMDGGAGNDAYYVDTGADLTFEAVGGGADTVYADVSNVTNAGVYLYANVENLVLLGTTAFGVGNELANTMTGSASANWLLGGAGNDRLNGKAGGDVLFGEAGADTFVFERGTGGDVIGDFLHGTDKIDISAFGFGNFAALQANFIQNGDVGAINLGGGDFIVLHNVSMSQLSAGDFVL